LVAKRPNDLMTSYTWRKMMMNQLGKYDRAYSIIRKDRAGRVIELFPIPSRWVVLRLIGNELVYEITDYYNNGEKYYLSEYSVFHLIGYTEDGLEGRSRINILKNQIGGAIASEDFASEFYGKGVNVSGFIKTKKMLKDQDAVERLKSSFVKAVAGKNNTFGVGLLEDDADWIPNEMDPNKAQLSEARKLNALTVAQMYNMPLQLLKYAEGGGKTQEQLDLQYLKYTLTPYLVNWEQEAERKLLTEREKDSGNIYYKFNINALLRGDMVSRGRYYESMTKTGAYTPNKILSHEDEDGFEGGDVHIIPSGYQTLESLDNAEIQE
jgi:HK97 family phage portal protein